MSQTPRFVLVTGLSGAGKSQALRFLEDRGYYCVDNLPVALIPTFAELVKESEVPRTSIAVCVDGRAGKELLQLGSYLDTLTELGFQPDTLFLETSDEVLQHRYSESRRRHPCSPTGSIEEGIRIERELLGPIRDRADLVLDTSAISTSELRERIMDVFAGAREHRGMIVSVLSFGFKYGVPPDVDLVLDVRFLPNPHYDVELQPLAGDAPEVRDYVLDNAPGQEFLDRIKGLLKFLIPRYELEPKSYLTIGVGCTGGRHRSVAVAGEVHRLLRDLECNARLRHRDIDRGAANLL